MGWTVNTMPRPLNLRETDLVPIVQEARWASGLVWTGPENFALPGYELWTVQPVASHYNDYAIPATLTNYNGFKQVS
jgi:hypothetical protein